MTAPHLAQILVYPIKSLPGSSVPAAKVLASGAIEHDRRWAIHDASGKVVNAKRTAAIHALRATFDDSFRRVTVWTEDREQATFDLHANVGAFEAWLTEFFGFAVVLLEDVVHGFPDDLDSPGPTIVSTATLAEVATWFPGLTLDEVRRRFRANLELDGVEAFWEDRLFNDDAGSGVTMRLGLLALEGVNPCQRCVVPSRDSLLGDITAGFAHRFARQRQATLPAWAPVSRFDHYYRLAVNTRPPLEHRPGMLHVGDAIEVIRSNPA